MIITIDRESYTIQSDEYRPYTHPVFSSLRLHHDLALHERLVGILIECGEFFRGSMISFATRFGGFIPIQASGSFSSIMLASTDDVHLSDILKNLASRPHITNIVFDDPNNGPYLLFTHDDGMAPAIMERWNSPDSHLLICTNPHAVLPNEYVFAIKGTPMFIHVKDIILDRFKTHFHLSLEDGCVIAYDNLINMCFMVKDAGPGFEKILTDNLPFMDRWTILDTGSTDETMDIIRRVLVGKKKGNLYREPFIDFGASRNRLLDLAGTSCKYTVMLDDTYTINGDLRQFLTDVRSDQFSSSFSLNIVSGDMMYGSNRILKSSCNLRYIYKIHEVISPENNVNIIIPHNVASIIDHESAYMDNRTMTRKSLDLVLLFRELEENPNDSRIYYYIAQTYSYMQHHEKAFDYFMLRGGMAGMIQERFDAIFEAARIANFHLKRPWSECERLYLRAIQIDDGRPEPFYFLGIHHMMEGSTGLAYLHFRTAFLLGFPVDRQYSLRPTISFYFIPKFMPSLCYEMEDYALGRRACELFLRHNHHTTDNEIISWHKIFEQLMRMPPIAMNPRNDDDMPILCFHADGGYRPWSGSDIEKNGVGGSETYIIEMATAIRRTGMYKVVVFCRTPQTEIYRDVIYRHLDDYYEFIASHHVHTCIVSRYSEYLPATFNGNVDRVYMVLHDLTPSGVVIPLHPKLKKIFCLTDWHAQYFTTLFPQTGHLTSFLHYGLTMATTKEEEKKKYSFIYSSFPDRGLLELLQMWSRIHRIQSEATLHIYSDVHHPQMNQIQPEMMHRIRELLDQEGVHYHGWVSKSQLKDAWRTAHIWLYPCTFQETFCLTALEAARSRTLAITTPLAALRETVADRGIMIEGHPSTAAWQDAAINLLGPILKNERTYQELIERNYEWSLARTWERQAHLLLSDQKQDQALHMLL